MGINTIACKECDHIFYGGSGICCHTCGSRFCGYCKPYLKHCGNRLNNVQEKKYMHVLIKKLNLKSKIYSEADDPTGDLYDTATSNLNNGKIVIDMDHLFESFPNLNDDMYKILLENGIGFDKYCHEDHPKYNSVYECTICTKNTSKRKINFEKFFYWLFNNFDMDKEKMIKDFFADLDEQK